MGRQLTFVAVKLMIISQLLVICLICEQSCSAIITGWSLRGLMVMVKPTP